MASNPTDPNSPEQDPAEALSRAIDSATEPPSTPPWRRPLLALFAAQLAAGALVFLLSLALFAGTGSQAPIWALLIGQALMAVGLSRMMGLAPGWGWFQAAFPFALYGGLIAPVPPWLWLVIAIGVALVYRNVLKDRVPLYLSNATTWAAVADLLPEDKSVTFIDLGSGFGGILAYLARNRSNVKLIGVESAPVVAMVSKLRFLFVPKDKLDIRFGDIWDQDLSEVDVIYCFLSPVPMAKLYEKVEQAAVHRPITLISNSFEVPGHDPDELLILDDNRQTKLLVWRLGPRG